MTFYVLLRPGQSWTNILGRPVKWRIYRPKVGEWTTQSAPQHIFNADSKTLVLEVQNDVQGG